VHEEERAAAQAGGLRFDQAEHELRGDGGIDRAAARRI
jgi:hypothetical protein